MRNSHRLNLSVIIPFYNEDESILPMYEALHNTVTLLGRSYELIFVDDGSADDTCKKLKWLQRRDPAVRVIRFRRNFGQTAAMRAGILASRAKVIVTMDGDLQNDPRDIPKMIDKIEEGYDLVLGWRKNRKDPLLSRTLPSRMANKLIGWITGVKIHDSGCSLKVYRASMIKKVPLYSEMHRFIPAMSTLLSARIAEVVVQHHPRRLGKSKYGLSRIGKVLLDVIAIKMLISFRHRPLRWFSYLAIPFALLAVLTGGYSLLLKLTNIGDAHLISPAVFLLCSYLAAHLVTVGLLAEIVIRSNRSNYPHPKTTIDHVNTAN